MGTCVVTSAALPQRTNTPLQMKVILAAVILAVASAAPDSPPSYRPPSGYTPEPVYKAAPIPSHFDSAVTDHYSGANFAQSEESDGHNIKGSYTVALPDGRLQTVTYVADHEAGFNAEVTYQGEAKHPEYQPRPSGNKPAPYKPAPAPYKPAPVAYKPAPVVYKPAPKPYKPAPAPYKPESAGIRNY